MIRYFHSGFVELAELMFVCLSCAENGAMDDDDDEMPMPADFGRDCMSESETDSNDGNEK